MRVGGKSMKFAFAIFFFSPQIVKTLGIWKWECMWQHGPNTLFLLYWIPLPSWKRSVSPRKDSGRQCPGKFLSCFIHFIHFSQHRAMGLLLLNEETRAHTQRGSEQYTFPSVRQCGILVGKPKLPGAEPGAQAVPMVSWEGCRTFCSPLGKGETVWRLGGSAGALRWVRDVS